MKRHSFVLLSLLYLTLQTALRAEVPAGLANQSFPQEDLFQVISYLPTVLHGEEGLPDNPTYSIMVDGHIVVSCDEGAAVLDLTDPYNVEVLSTYWYDIGRHQPEYDNWGLTTGYGGIHTVRYDTSFLEFVDYTDPTNPSVVGRVDSLLPCHLWRENGSHAGWGYPTAIAWQAPYLYSSMRNTGIDIIDVHDIENPVHVKRFANDGDKYRPGSIHAVGNLLIVAAYNWNGMGIWDISDPVNPVQLTWEGEGWKSPAHGWQVFVNGNKLYRSGEVVYVWDMSDPADLKHITTYEINAECTTEEGHCSSGGVEIQDNYLFLGGSHHGIYKWNLETEELVGYSGPFHKPDKQEKHDYYDLDYPNVIGNYVMGCSEDHFQGAFIIPHQAEADNTPPKVNMVIPKDNAANQAVTSRVGITLTDAVNPASVTASSFVVKESGGSAVPGKYSMYKSIVNFSPDEPLEVGTTYEVLVPAGGITDYMGNAITEPFNSRFSTGSEVAVAPAPQAKEIMAHGSTTALQVRADNAFRNSSTANRGYSLFTIRGTRVSAHQGTDHAASRGIPRGVYVISGNE